jgi:cytochrome c551/c552
VWLAAGSMLLWAPMYTRQASSQVQKPAATDVSSHAALVNRSCVSCHSDKLKTGGLSLQQVDVTGVSADA